jgi:hypothetical protein
MIFNQLPQKAYISKPSFEMAYLSDRERRRYEIVERTALQTLHWENLQGEEPAPT